MNKQTKVKFERAAEAVGHLAGKVAKIAANIHPTVVKVLKCFR